jgi:integrase
MKRRGLPKFASEYKNQHGVWTVRLRRKGWPTVYPKSNPSTDEFAEEYRRWLGGQLEIGGARTKPGSLRALVVDYFNASDFRSLKASTSSVYRNIIERLCEETGTTGIKIGDMPAVAMKREHIVKLMAKRKPHAANRLRKILRNLMRHAIEIGMRKDDPTQTIKLFKSKNKIGFHRWAEEEIAQFESRHPVGTKARLAMALGLYFGQARQDVVVMGPQHIRNEVLHWTRLKTETSTATELFIPVHRELRKIIDATPSRHLTFLVTDFGKPFAVAGFGNWFRERCDEAGLPRCSFHGLRKAAASRLAEAGCSAHEIASITGHASLKEVERYTRTADRKRLAVSAMAKIKGSTENG